MIEFITVIMFGYTFISISKCIEMLVSLHKTKAFITTAVRSKVGISLALNIIYICATIGLIWMCFNK